MRPPAPPAAKKFRALDAWVARVGGWRAKRRRVLGALFHYATRLKAAAFSALLAGWQVYQARLTRALMYRSMRNDGLKRAMLREWRLLVAWLQLKNGKTRL